MKNSRIVLNKHGAVGGKHDRKPGFVTVVAVILAKNEELNICGVYRIAS